MEYLNNQYKIPNLEILFRNKLNSFYKYLFGQEYYLNSWEYNQKSLFISENINDKNIIISIFNNYIKLNNIKIDNIYGFDYYNVLVKCHLIKPINKYFKTVLNFIIEYYNNQYAPYYFNRGYINYWTYKENRIFTLKYLIENDLKIELNKIPMHITLSKLMQIGTKCLYNVCKKYYNSLFEWINECYPDKFVEKDFDINFIKEEFDSIEEKQINDILHSNIKNIYYNNLNTDNVIKLNGMIPDWLIFGQELILIEYFGYYTKTPTTSRQTRYMETYNNKIDKYKKLPYKTFFIYPDDLNNNYNKLINKINILKKEGLVYE